jgi:hypothetical protein
MWITGSVDALTVSALIRALPKPKRRREVDLIWSHRSSPVQRSRVETLWIFDRSVRPDIGRPDHLAPLLGFVGDEPTESGW